MPAQEASTSKKRPIGIACLAVLIYLYAMWFALLAAGWLVAPVKTGSLLEVIHRASRAIDVPSLVERIPLFLLAAGISAASYFCGRGLWQLKNWARIIAIVICALNVPIGGRSLETTPIGSLLPDNPVLDLIGRLLWLSVIVYLQSRAIRDAFGKPPLSVTWKIVWSAAGVYVFIGLLFKSGPEINAVKWHAKHGSQYTVNGISFPIPPWQFPDEDSGKCALHIWDRPGPLRDAERPMMISLYACKDREKSVEQRVAEQIESYQRSGYTGMQRVSLVTEWETMQCVQEDFYERSLNCFGDGPISAAYFSGGLEQEKQFRSLMIQAKNTRKEIPAKQ